MTKDVYFNKNTYVNVLSNSWPLPPRVLIVYNSSNFINKWMMKSHHWIVRESEYFSRGLSTLVKASLLKCVCRKLSWSVVSSLDQTFLDREPSSPPALVLPAASIRGSQALHCPQGQFGFSPHCGFLKLNILTHVSALSLSSPCLKSIYHQCIIYKAYHSHWRISQITRQPGALDPTAAVWEEQARDQSVDPSLVQHLQRFIEPLYQLG